MNELIRKRLEDEFPALSQKNPDRNEKYWEEIDHNPVVSIDDAIVRIQLHSTQCRMVLDEIIRRGVYGRVSAFHRLIELFSQYNDYEGAYIICIYALGIFENSRDLFADIIEISLNSAEPEMYCAQYVDKLLNSERKYWDLRLYIVLIRYFYQIIENNILNGFQKELFEKAIQIALDMQKRYKGDEAGYLAQVKLLMLTGSRDEARQLLEEWIFSPLDPKVDTRRVLQCPKCCRIWIEEFQNVYGNQNMKDHIIKKGLIESEDPDDKAFFYAQKIKMDERHRIEQSIIEMADGLSDKIRPKMVFYDIRTHAKEM